MAIWISPQAGVPDSLLLVTNSPANRVIAVLEKHSGWTDAYQQYWLDTPDFWYPYNMREQFPDHSREAFEFKGKFYVKLGQCEGLTKIRSVFNLTGDSRDNVQFLGGEEEEEAA